MVFWKPTRRKLVAFVLLLLLIVLGTTVQRFTAQMTKQWRVETFKEAIGTESVAAFRAAVDDDFKVRGEAMAKIDQRAMQRIDHIAMLQNLIDTLLPVLLAYLAACVIHAPRKASAPAA